MPGKEGPANTARRLSPQELYRLRRAALDAEGKALAAHMARHALHCLLLEVEKKYWLLGSRARLDIYSGLIQEANHEPIADEDQGPP